MIERYIPERIEHGFRDSINKYYQSREQYNFYEGNPRGTVWIRNYVDGTGNHYYDASGNELLLESSDRSNSGSYTNSSPISFSIPENLINNSNELALPEDFPTVRFNDQVWMGKNLHIADEGRGISYNRKTGELFYNWEAAVRICEKLKGWHLPTKDEAEKLMRDSSDCLVEKLGLSSLGGFTEFGTLYNRSSHAYIWLSTESNDNLNYADSICISFTGQVDLAFNSKHYGYFVRCLKD